MTDEEIAALYQRAFGNTADNWNANAIAQFRSSPHNRIVASDHAVLMATWIHDEAEIINIFVAPEARGGGHASRLMNDWFEQIRDADVERVHLEVAADNDNALAFYQRMRFDQVGTRKNYYQRGGKAPVDALLFTKLL